VRVLARIVPLILLSPLFLIAQPHSNEQPRFDYSKKFSVIVYGTFIASAELQNDIDNEISILRDASIELSGGYGYGGELSYNPNIYDVDIRFYLSSEYINIKDDQLALQLVQDTNIANVRFTEEFSMIPVEGGLKWNLPVSSDNFKVYIGGGAGMYFGTRERTIGTLKTSSISTTPGFSMNVLAGMEYYIGRNLSVDFEFKFRDASFETESKFNVNNITVNGNSYYIGEPINSRLLVNGTRLSLGLKYNF
jgi:opacity protein-like surface antigen